MDKNPKPEFKEEITEKLFGVIDLNWLIGQGKQEIEFLCNKHL